MLMNKDHILNPLGYFLLAKNIRVAVERTSSALILPFLLWSKTLAKDDN